ncbi:histidine kinase [Dactylosporangium sp. NPDC005572]|uniref:sensor histidine kinase n=1 Tax=Dactylosporangium sp. NPDC005572 TaxID=3156889 RepID=UPI0033A8A140
MRRYISAAGAVVVDSVLLAAARPGGVEPALVPVYALVLGLIAALRWRSAAAAFVAALVPAGLTGGASMLLAWTGYQAGRELARPRHLAVAAGAVAGALGAQLAFRADDGRRVAALVSTYVVFALLPLLSGRYAAQQDQLAAAVDRHRVEVRRRREAVAEQDRLRERLRIARDLHDSLGQRLRLVSHQAADLENEHEAVRRLAASLRGAVTEFHQLAGVLRTGDEPREREPGLAAIGPVVEEYRAAGVPVVLRRRGAPGAMSRDGERAAFLVLEEGLRNAVKHAPGQPITVDLEWEPDALLLSVANPAAGEAGGEAGLARLAERVHPAGGFLDHRLADGVFRLWAVLPVGGPAPEPDEAPEAAPAEAPSRARTVALVVAAAAAMFVALPLTLMIL